MSQSKLVCAVFRDRLQAEQAFDYLRGVGYAESDINVLMSDKSHSTFSPTRPSDEPRYAAGSYAAEGAGVGGAIGTAIGAAVAGVAAVGTTLAIPALGLIVAGPLIAAFAGAGAGAVTGGVIGALVGWGMPQQNARAYEEALRRGGIVIGVRPRLGDDVTALESKFQEFGGENVCYV
jgi:hypothetical protein